MRIKNTITAISIAVGVGSSSVLAGVFTPLGFGEGISYTSQHSITPGTNIFEIGGPDGGFYFDPDAGGWEKQLLAPPDGFQPFQVYTVREWFTFVPPPSGFPSFALEDWHETIELGLDGQVWDIWVLDSGAPNISFDRDSGEPIPGLEFMISLDATELWFDFDPIDIGPNGVTLHIDKEFRFIGNTPSFDPVVITQYPTPTPGSLAVLGLAGLIGSKRRR
ncbi:MAG: hypothetical protein WD114_00015 [Phycisphaerales bacterium]